MSNARGWIRKLAVVATLTAGAAVLIAASGAQHAAAQGFPLTRFTGRTIGTPIPGGYQIVAVVPEPRVAAFWALSDRDRKRIVQAFYAAGARRFISGVEP